MWSRRGQGSPVGKSSSEEECSRAGEVKSAWAWQPSRLVSAASEETAIGAHGPVRTGGESVDDGRGLFATAAKCRLTSGTGLLLGGDEGDRDGGKVPVDDGHGLLLGGDGGDRDGGKVQVDDGHGLLLGRDEGDRDGGKVQVDEGHGLFARKRRRCPDREYLYGIYAS